MSYKYKHLTSKDRNYKDNIESVMKDIALDEIDGMNEENARYYLMNDAIPSTGSVTNLIYYSQTEPIAKEYYNEIVEYIYEIYGESIPFRVVESLNNLTWFAWEYNILGNEENIDAIIELAKEKGLLNED